MARHPGHAEPFSGAFRVSFASDYIGLPFESGGRGPESVDCWGLVCLVYRREAGIDLPPYGEIGAREARRVSRAVADEQCLGPWRAVVQPRAMDVCVMRAPGHRLACHVGVMADSETVLHVEAGACTHLQRVDDLMLRPRILGYWRHEALA